MITGVHAQSKLPSCTSAGFFHNCFVSYTNENGDKYIGEWGDHSISKEGVFTSSGGSGLVEKFNGQGVATFRDGHKFVGEFKDGKPNGRGALFDSDGSLINQGIWANGNFMSSVFQDPSYNGQGTHTSAGNKYVGDWVKGMYSGKGTFTLATGGKYVGDFKDNKYHGQGSLYASNGLVVVAGIWASGNFVRSESVQQSSLDNLNASNCKKPEYPDASKRLEEEGTVQVLFSIEADGKVNAALGKSSGYRRLDLVAVRAVSECKFRPATFGGIPQHSWARINFAFQTDTAKN
jgi:TonB family protein